MRLARRRDRVRGQAGQALVEYGLIVVLVSVAIVLGLAALGGQLSTAFNAVVSAF